MSLHCHWCPDDFNVQHCHCCCDPAKRSPTKNGQLEYNSPHHQITIQTCPNIQFGGLVVFEHLQETDTYTVAYDAECTIRFVDYAGTHTQTLSETKEKDLRGQAVKDILPAYAQDFLVPIYEQTLSGEALKLQLNWAGTAFLLQTFPLKRRKHDKITIAAQVMMAPFRSEYYGDMKEFILQASQRRTYINHLSRDHFGSQETSPNRPISQKME